MLSADITKGLPQRASVSHQTPVPKGPSEPWVQSTWCGHHCCSLPGRAQMLPRADICLQPLGRMLPADCCDPVGQTRGLIRAAEETDVNEELKVSKTIWPGFYWFFRVPLTSSGKTGLNKSFCGQIPNPPEP